MNSTKQSIRKAIEMITSQIAQSTMAKESFFDGTHYVVPKSDYNREKDSEIHRLRRVALRLRGYIDSVDSARRDNEALKAQVS